LLFGSSTSYQVFPPSFEKHELWRLFWQNPFPSTSSHSFGSEVIGVSVLKLTT